MADYGGATISLSQAAHTTTTTSDDDDGSSSDHSPRSLPTLATTPKSGSASASTSSSKPRTTSTPNNNNNNKISTIDCRQQIIHSTADNSATRKPRGRPPGSKNKPKPPIVITRDSDSVMKPVILEISAGADIIENIINFASRNNAGISVISASGSVSTVTLRHPTAHVPSLSLHGPFNLLSLSGTFLGYSSKINNITSPATTSPPSFGVTLAAAQGQVFGGVVAGKVTAAGQVVVVATTFVNPSLHMLPISEEGGDHHHHHHHHHQTENKADAAGAGTAGGGGGGGGGGASTDQSCSSAGISMMPVYGGGGGVANPTPLNCHLPPDVMPWGPRPPY